MVNTGKRKYTKKKIMRGGAISFSLLGFEITTPNGIVPAPTPLQIIGNSVLNFIDGTRDTFFNTFRRVKFSKSCSKCYLVNPGTANAPRLTPYQLIYDMNGNVYQYAAYNYNISRLVQQISQIKDEDVAKILTVTPVMANKYSLENMNKNPVYKEWETKLYNFIINGQISIDQIITFYHKKNVTSNFSGRSASKFWSKFHSKYERHFF